MKNKVKLLDVIALTKNLPEKGLIAGQVGTVVEILEQNVFEVDFSDEEGQTYASVALRFDQIIVLHYEPTKAVA